MTPLQVLPPSIADLVANNYPTIIGVLVVYFAIFTVLSVTAHRRIMSSVAHYVLGSRELGWAVTPFTLFVSVSSRMGSGNVIGAVICSMKTYGLSADEMLIHEDRMKAAMGEIPKRFHGEEESRQPSTRPGVAATLREALMEADDYVDRREHAPARASRSSVTSASRTSPSSTRRRATPSPTSSRSATSPRSSARPSPPHRSTSSGTSPSKRPASSTRKG